MVFGLTQPEIEPKIEPKSTVLVTDALSTGPLFGCLNRIAYLLTRIELEFV